ncbi:MAG TPA: exonuclease domain-containing protein [Noviherbaspirillum sp.]|uniref:exonuclease domain-containing protein n=1 Tax=Noviherbaspirillum sp. TaxID=1926288 RepID=UPI002F91D974
MNNVSLHRFPRLAFVDLETTGGTASMDRITEVGIIEVDEDGVREWSSLVNPEVPIPPFIQTLTGITDDMVRDAPTFAELAAGIARRLEDRIFIAHNARFDYGFLRQAFRRTGRDFHPEVLCTVKLSRRLFPGFERHNLDSVAERHALHVTERHRALGDAQLLWQFWQKIHDLHAPEQIEEAVRRLLSRPALPSRIEELELDRLPASHGVYILRGADRTPLFIGSAVNLQARVYGFFGKDRMTGRDRLLAAETAEVDWIETSGELGALLLESALLRQHATPYNHVRGDDETCAWRLLPRGGALQGAVATSDDLFFAYDPELYGLYANPAKAREALRAVADSQGLCHALLGLEKTRAGKSCSARAAGHCRGACIGLESVEEHNQRVRAALQSQRLQAWPYPGPVAIPENGAWHLVDGWAYLGTAHNEMEKADLLKGGRRRFDRDVYRILQKWLPVFSEKVKPQ